MYKSRLENCQNCAIHALIIFKGLTFEVVCVRLLIKPIHEATASCDGLRNHRWDVIDWLLWKNLQLQYASYTLSWRHQQQTHCTHLNCNSAHPANIRVDKICCQSPVDVSIKLLIAQHDQWLILAVPPTQAMITSSTYLLKFGVIKVITQVNTRQVGRPHDETHKADSL